MITVGKLPDNSLDRAYLETIGRFVNVVKDCDDNFIVSMVIAEALLYEGLINEIVEIDWCQLPEEV